MTPGIRTEAVFKLRILTSTVGTWVIRDEYDDDGHPIGSQQLRADGSWGEIHPDGELYAGNPHAPTTPCERPSPFVNPPVMTTPPYYGGSWVSGGTTYGPYTVTNNTGTTTTTGYPSMTVSPTMMKKIQS